MDLPLVSVIMGVYNSESREKLVSSIQSILKQTYKNIEFVICDDGSTKSFISEALENEASKDKRIKLIRNDKNHGLAFSLNNCIKHSRGQFIARQDDDDLSALDRIEKEVDFLLANERFGFVGTNMWLYDETGVYGKRDGKQYPDKNGLLFGVTYFHPTLLFRREVLASVGNYSIDKIIRRTEDYDLYLKFAYKGISGANLQERLYFYSENSYTFKKQKFKYRVDEFKLRKRWFKKLGFPFYKRTIALLKPIISGLTPVKIKKSFREKSERLTDKERIYSTRRFSLLLNSICKKV